MAAETRTVYVPALQREHNGDVVFHVLENSELFTTPQSAAQWVPHRLLWPEDRRALRLLSFEVKVIEP